MKEKLKRDVSFTSLRQKLYSALAMLLVSSIMMVSSTYAWFVMSTAPEVTGIQTQVGANGALEIALLDQASWNDLSRLDMGDIDEGSQETAVSANLTWGNLVNLSDSSYGLSQITLMPSRLYVENNGDAYKVNSTILKTPVYGEDGRVKELDKTSAVALICNGGNFDTLGYGVRAIGTAASMSSFQLGMNGARSQLATYTSAARTAASNTLNENGSALANIVIKYALENKVDGYTADDVGAVLSLAQGLQKSLGQIENALRQVYAGYITTAGSGITDENYQNALAEIQDPATSLSTLKATYASAAALVPEIGNYVDMLLEKQRLVQTAIDTCTAKINAGGTYTWNEILAIVEPIADINKMTVGGKNISQLKAELKNEDGTLNYGAAMSLVTGGITIAVPTGSGLLADIADYAGDYTCKVSVSVQVDALGPNPVSVDANMKTETSVNPVYLTVCSRALAGASVSDATGSTAITDYYGYALDLAFRTNAEDSHLLLQTEPENRIYAGSSENAGLQGAGSYMTFQTQAGLSATKMVKLMSGLRVVFMDREQNVLAMGALDTALGSDVYTVLSEDEQADTGKYAYLSGGMGDYQQSDLIDELTYRALPEKSNVIFDSAAGTVTAKLYLYSFDMTMAGEGENQHQTGGITLGAKKTDAVITALAADTPQEITAVVYLDGSSVNNSMVAASSTVSMSGSLNLQFSSDALLMPAENQSLRAGSSEDNAND